MEEDVSASVRREWFNFWLLLAAAGVSSQLTSALLRQVLRRGLVLPCCRSSCRRSWMVCCD